MGGSIAIGIKGDQSEGCWFVGFKIGTVQSEMAIGIWDGGGGGGIVVAASCGVTVSKYRVNGRGSLNWLNFSSNFQGFVSRPDVDINQLNLTLNLHLLRNF